MPGEPVALVDLALVELGSCLLPLAGVDRPARATALLAALGYELPGAGDLVEGFAGAAAAAAELPELIDLVTVAETVEEAAAAVLPLTSAVLRAVESVEAIIDRIGALAGAIPGFDATVLVDLPRRLVDYLLITYLQAARPTVHAVLVGLGVVEITHVAAMPSRFQSEFDHRVVRWEVIPRLVTRPDQVLAEMYAWGEDFTATRFLDNVYLLGRLAGIPAGRYEVPGAVRAVLGPNENGLPEVRVPLLASGTWPDRYVEAGVAIGVSPGAEPADRGLAARPYLRGQAEFTVPLSPNWSLTISGSAALSDGVVVKVHPVSGMSIDTDVLSGAGGGGGESVELMLEIARTAAVGARTVVFGTADGPRFEVGDVALRGGLDMQGWDVAIVIGHAACIVAGGQDGFLASVLPDDPLEVAVDLTIGWSGGRGLYVAGGAGLEYRARLDVAIGPVVVESVVVGLAAVDARVEVAAAATLRVAVGPFTAVVAGLGVRASLSQLGSSGNVGFGQLDVGVKPPSGVGLAIKTPAVSGGGFLELNYAAGRYSGVFELTIVKTVSVKVTGIITTRLPDGSPGFALLLMITAEGFTPIQLGMGFVLTGIGGLIALNRTIDVEAVRGGLSSGVLDSVLFAKDPVANADRIIATLETIFPLAPDRLLIGPLAEIGWGSPPVVKVRLALLLEIPQPVRVVLLAALALALPDEDAPVVELHVDAIGVLDLGRGELALDASLHHSRLWKFALTGDLALRLNWGDDPTFLLSVGGFHPAFTPPAGLRQLERLTFSLSDSENPRIRFETYLAVTSNTIQLGARVSVLFESGGFGVDGGGAFDALVQWVPFGLDVRFEAWIRIFSPAGTLCAARLALQVTGPQPWHVVGVASLQVLAFQVQVGVDFHVGDPLEPVAVEAVDVVELLWEELTRPGSWVTALPAGRTSGATLGGTAADPVAATGQPLLVHPLGTLSVRQKVVPLGTPVTRIGALRPKAGPGSYDLDVESPTGIVATPLVDRFAAAQFTDLTEDEKLSAPSFVSWPAGLSFAPAAGDGVPTGRAVSSDLAFETLDVTSLEEPAVASGGSSPGIAEEILPPTGPAGWAGLAVVHA